LVIRLRAAGIIAGPDHFVIGDGYGNPDNHCSLFIIDTKLYKSLDLLQILLDRLWEQIKGLNFNYVIAPNEQSLPLAEMLSGLAEKHKGGQVEAVLFDPNNLPPEDSTILLHDDIVNKGRQAGDVLKILKKANRRLVAISSIFTRIDGGELFGVPVFSAIDRQLACYPPQNCPLCKQGLAINTRYGKGKDYLKNRSLDNTEQEFEQSPV